MDVRNEKFLCSVYYEVINHVKTCRIELWSCRRYDNLVFIIRDLSVKKFLKEYLFNEVFSSVQILSYKGYRRILIGMGVKD
jgi:hypothetical protein